MSKLPERMKQTLWTKTIAIRALPYYGNRRFCPVCGKTSRCFKVYGIIPREEAQCPHCESLERHRLIWLFMQRETGLFDGVPKKMLHVAPEHCFESKLKKLLGGNYLTADLFNPGAMVKMDVTDIQYPDQSFDVIYCCHVLEHVQNDTRAIMEFHRVLKDSGWAIILVPITSDQTFEDSAIATPEERLKVFGQEDHVRKYGPDFVDRLCEAGFTVKTSLPRDFVSNKEMQRMRVPGSYPIFYCTKSASINKT